MSKITTEYLNFRSSIPQKKICINENQTWVLYDAGPKAVSCPLIFLPPASGKADVYFLQLLELSKLGYRAIAIEYPALWTVRDFCLGFNKLLEALHLEQIHLFGSAIGGFLAMKFAQFARSAKIVQSIILCNSFTDSSIFSSRFPAIPPAIFWILPSLVLRKLVMSGFGNVGECDKATKYSVDFMKHSLDSLNQEELASRLVLNCTNDYVQPQYLRNVNMMIIQVNNCDALDQLVTDETSKCFPEAKVAHLKSGGNFPFISRWEDINVFIQIHLKPYLTMGCRSPVDKDNVLTNIVREAEALTAPEITSSLSLTLTEVTPPSSSSPQTDAVPSSSGSQTEAVPSSQTEVTPQPEDVPPPSPHTEAAPSSSSPQTDAVPPSSPQTEVTPPPSPHPEDVPLPFSSPQTEAAPSSSSPQEKSQGFEDAVSDVHKDHDYYYGASSELDHQSTTVCQHDLQPESSHQE